MPTPEPHHTVRIEVTDGALIPDAKDPRIITAWSLSLLGAVSLLIFLCTKYPDPYWKIVQLLPEGIAITFKVTLYAIFFTIPLGCLVGIGRLSGNRAVNLVVSTYVEVIRGIPLLVQLFYLYYGLSALFNIPETLAAVISLSFCYGAYMGEVFRAGISSISKGQTEAARSLGFNRFQTMWYIVLPQALRIAFPAISCGVFGYPPALAAAVVMHALQNEHAGFEITVCCYSEPMRAVFQRVLDALA